MKKGPNHHKDIVV